MSRYQARFAELKRKKQAAFIPFTVLGWPNPEQSRTMLKTFVENGVAALEVGFAFSDPVADGPIIQQACQDVLSTGFGVADGFRLIKEARSWDNEIPIGLLVYYNLILAQGVESFFKQAADAGVDGVLIPDLPPELAEEVLPTATRYGIDLIYIISPLTTEERLAVIARNAGGFLYAVSRLGITGTEERTDEALSVLIQRAHGVTELPVCVGFGVSTPEQAAKMVVMGANGFITGSRVLQLVEQSRDGSVSNSLSPYLQQMLQSALLAPV